jgi:hypothetical protein
MDGAGNSDNEIVFRFIFQTGLTIPWNLASVRVWGVKIRSILQKGDEDEENHPHFILPGAGLSCMGNYLQMDGSKRNDELHG